MPRRRNGPPSVRHSKDLPDPGVPNVALLMRNILEMLTACGVLPYEDLRERLCCASEMRMKAAIDELRAARFIKVGEGKDVLVQLWGERRPYFPITQGRRSGAPA